MNNQELLNKLELVIEDFELLSSGDWNPDIHSVEASIENLEFVKGEIEKYAHLNKEQISKNYNKAFIEGGKCSRDFNRNFDLDEWIESTFSPSTTVIDKLEKEIAQEENDFKVMGLQNKLLREKRSHKFTKDWLVDLKNKYDVVESDCGTKFTITTADYGKLDYFPKGNSLLIRKHSKWKKPGLKWIIKNLLK